jgi:hypothetical protein
MMSLDDQLRDLFQAEGPDAADLQGDVQLVRAEVRRRTFRRRAALGTIAAAVLAAGALLLTGIHRGDDVRTDVPPSGEHDTTTTTAPGPSSTDGTGTGTGTGTTTGPSSTTSSSTPSTTTTPPVPAIRDIDLGEATFTQACAGLGDTRSATLHGGTARLGSSGENIYDISLGPVGYADADGDGDEDAVLMLRCQVTAATQNNAAQLRAYRATSGGGIEQIGSSKVIEHDQPDPTADGLSITVERVEYATGDPDCCPSKQFQEIWTFNGSAFEKTFSTPIAFPDF